MGTSARKLVAHVVAQAAAFQRSHQIVESRFLARLRQPAPGCACQMQRGDTIYINDCLNATSPMDCRNRVCDVIDAGRNHVTRPCR